MMVILVLSAKRIGLDESEMDFGRSLIYNKKKRGTEYGALWNAITDWLPFGETLPWFIMYNYFLESVFLNKIPTIYLPFKAYWLRDAPPV
jgi:hypothetical protein